MDATLRRAGNLDFVKFFLNAIAAAGRKFYTSEHSPIESEILLQFAINQKTADQRPIADARLGAAVDVKTLRSLE